MSQEDQLVQVAGQPIHDLQTYITYESVLFGIVIWVSTQERNFVA